MKVVILMGAPGSGKGTQANIIKNVYNIIHISTGDLLREQINNNTDLGKNIQSLLLEGKLVDDKIITHLIDNEILNDKIYKKGFILDGYPRTLQQAKLLQNLFNKYKINNYKVIKINVDDNTIVKRIIGRYSCIHCGEIYNDFFKHPIKENVCDTCGSRQFSRRSDDTENTVKKRLETYNEHIKPILQWYKSLSVYKEIDGALELKQLKLKLIEIIN